uniref:Uncharacterized protein n=1 Tax=Noctiluca scintillans TaxID=2966 RepID=A0A7S1ADJ4_NOCSC|mmetsp:Transcript_41969/g.111101  ORF Transcript_41969/g.111101 Transcript_41969/m.111101 type:complete len:124 (+) Transcript_41969:47-418(+)
MAQANDEAFAEQLRPKSLKELHESVQKGSTRRRLPPIVSKLQEFCERRAECEAQCLSRLKERAATEIGLLPLAEDADGELQLRRKEVAEFAHQRFVTLEALCQTSCSRRYAHLVGGEQPRVPS